MSPRLPTESICSSLTWKEDGPNPDVNFGSSMGRLKTNFVKLRRNPEILAHYNQIMVDQLEMELGNQRLMWIIPKHRINSII